MTQKLRDGGYGDSVFGLERAGARAATSPRERREGRAS